MFDHEYLTTQQSPTASLWGVVSLAAFGGWSAYWAIFWTIFWRLRPNVVEDESNEWYIALAVASAALAITALTLGGSLANRRNVSIWWLPTSFAFGFVAALALTALVSFWHAATFHAE
jgi:hypothetical protein